MKGRIDPAIPLWGMYPEDWKAGSRRDTCTFMFMEALFTIVKRWKSNPDVHPWMSGKNVEYTYSGTSFSLKREEILTCYNMKEPQRHNVK